MFNASNEERCRLKCADSFPYSAKNKMDNNDRKPGGKSCDETVALVAHHQQKATDKGRKSNDPLPPLPDQDPFLTVNLFRACSKCFGRCRISVFSESPFRSNCFHGSTRKRRGVFYHRASVLLDYQKRHLTSVTLQSFRVFLSSGLEISAPGLLKRDSAEDCLTFFTYRSLI